MKELAAGNSVSPLAFLFYALRNVFIAAKESFIHVFWVIVAWLVAPRKPRLRILLVGQPRSGKTTILFRLKIGVYIAPMPTSGILRESIYLPEVPVEPSPHHSATVDILEVGHNPAVSIKYRVWVGGGVCECELPYNYLEIFAMNVEHFFSTLWGEDDTPDTEMRSGFSWEDEMWSKMLPISDIVFYVMDSSNAKSLQNARQDVEFLLFGSESPVTGKLAILANKQDVRSAYSKHFVEHTLQIPPEVRHRCKVFPVSAIANTGAAEALAWSLETLPDSPIMRQVSANTKGADSPTWFYRKQNKDETELRTRGSSQKDFRPSSAKLSV